MIYLGEFPIIACPKKQAVDHGGVDYIDRPGTGRRGDHKRRPKSQAAARHHPPCFLQPQFFTERQRRKDEQEWEPGRHIKQGIYEPINKGSAAERNKEYLEIESRI